VAETAHLPMQPVKFCAPYIAPGTRRPGGLRRTLCLVHDEDRRDVGGHQAIGQWREESVSAV